MVSVIIGREVKIRLDMNEAELKIANTHPPGVVFNLTTEQIEQLQGAASIGVIVNNKELNDKDDENNSEDSE